MTSTKQQEERTINVGCTSTYMRPHTNTDNMKIKAKQFPSSYNNNSKHLIIIILARTCSVMRRNFKREQLLTCSIDRSAACKTVEPVTFTKSKV